MRRLYIGGPLDGDISNDDFPASTVHVIGFGNDAHVYTEIPPIEGYNVKAVDDFLRELKPFSHSSLSGEDAMGRVMGLCYRNAHTVDKDWCPNSTPPTTAQPDPQP